MTPEEIAAKKVEDDAILAAAYERIAKEKEAADAQAKTDAWLAAPSPQAAPASPGLPQAAPAVSPKSEMRNEAMKGLSGLMDNSNQDPMARSKNNAVTIAALRGSRRDMRGNLIDETTGLGPAAADPFKNGFFKTRAERIAKEAEVFGTDPSETSTAKSQGYLTPAQVAQQMRKQGQTYSSKTVPSINYGPDQDPAPFKGLMTPIRDSKGKQIGMEYMLNPNLPDKEKFKAENFGQIIGGMVKSTPGPRDPTVPVISDENGPQVYPDKPENNTPEANAEIDAVRAARQAKFNRNKLAQKARK